MAEIYITKSNAGIDGSAISLVKANDDQFAAQVPGINRDLVGTVKEWEGEAVIIHHHHATSSWIFIAIHDVTLGPAAGGTRIKVYPTPCEGLADAMRLSEAMTNKWAIINSEWGGGKAVLSLPCILNSNERRDLLTCYAQILNAMAGSFVTAGDLGTTTEDLVYLAGFTSHVTAGDQSLGESADSGVYTALGLRAAIRACLKQAFGDDNIRDRSVLIQGLGQVGGMLARVLVLNGAQVLLNDLDLNRVAEFQREIACDAVAAEVVYATPCDVYAPCGTGGTLNDETIASLSCRVICGGANNQLASPNLAEKLHRRGILYAPDYVVNAGGAIGLTMFSRGAPELEIYEKIEGIQDSLATIFQLAAELSCSPVRVADSIVKKVLAEARGKRPSYHLSAFN